MDKHLYQSVAELKDAVALYCEAGFPDPHLLSAAVLFGLTDVEVHKSERRWGKYLNMVAITGASVYALADLAQVPLEKAREMLDKYRAVVLA